MRMDLVAGNMIENQNVNLVAEVVSLETIAHNLWITGKVNIDEATFLNTQMYDVTNRLNIFS